MQSAFLMVGEFLDWISRDQHLQSRQVLFILCVHNIDSHVVAARDEMWLADAPQDAVLIFEPELGPLPYATAAQRRRA